MFSRPRNLVLRLLRVPHDPEPPAGAPGSLRVFRGGKNLYRLRLLRWALGQAGAIVGILFSVIFLDRLEASLDSEKARLKAPAPVQAPATAPAGAPATPTDAGKLQKAPKRTATSWSKASPEAKKRVRGAVARVYDRTPTWLFPLLRFFEYVGILAYFAQIPLTYAMVRLDFELRWYMVTDRSLRIRTGIASVQESTMSFANVQQVVVTQGPVQRLLGLADVRVQSAGGGGDQHEKGGGDSLHTGVFHGVENAGEIRDLILERLRRYRETGLGDPDESPPAAESGTPAPPLADAALAGAREMLEEARALRRRLAQKSETAAP